MKNRILLVINSLDGETSRIFPNRFFRSADYDKYDYDILVLRGENTIKGDKIRVRTLTENSYLDTSFMQGLKKIIARKHFGYIPILIWEKIRKKPDMKARLERVRLEGRYWACLALDLESTSYVAKNVLARTKILRYTFTGTESPYEEDYRAMKKFRYAICCDEMTAEDFARTYAFDREKTIVIPNTPDPVYIKEKAGEYTIEKNRKYVFTSVYPLTSVTQLEFITETVKELKKAGFEDFMWHIVNGSAEAVQKQTKLSLEKEGLSRNINFTEPDQNPYPYIKACHIYVHTSAFEGEAISIESAQILGKPILGTDTEKIKEMIIQGKTCPRDPKVFAENLMYMAEHKEEFPITYKVREDDQTIKQTENLFDRILP
ncbi:MAG: glycosyltransferase [Armatimonadetes bacterium]|nr:glycosyltransferase [Candidatus Hippobium faecium]